MTTSFLRANLAGLAVIREVEAAVAATSKEAVATTYGFLLATIKHILWVGQFYTDHAVACAATEAGLSFSIIDILAKANNQAPKHRDRNADMLTLIDLVKSKDANTARTLARDQVRKWQEAETADKADYAHMHPDVEFDGKRRLVAKLSDHIACEVDRVLNAMAVDYIKDTGIPYPVAYAKALVAKVLATDTPEAESEPLFSPMFLIGTDCRYHADGRIATTSGGLVELSKLVDEPLRNTGYAAVLAQDENDVPCVAALVAVARTPKDGDDPRGPRFANNFQRLVAVMENLVCANPGCTRAAMKCQFHHLISWHLGGKTEQTNLTALCATDNGRNDDDPDKPPKHGHAKRAPTTGRVGWQRTPDSPLAFNEHPLVRKGTRTYGELVYNFKPAKS